ERFSLGRRDKLRQQLAEVRLFEQVQLPGAIAGGETPDIGLTHEAARGGLLVAEVHEVHRDDLIDDARALARSLLAFELNRTLAAPKFVGCPFEDCNEDYVFSARVLQL